MAKKKAIESYIIELTPRFNKEAYEQERTKLKRAIERNFSGDDAYIGAKEGASIKRKLEIQKKQEQLATKVARRKREEAKLETEILRQKEKQLRIDERLNNRNQNKPSRLSWSKIKSGAAFGEAGMIAATIISGTVAVKELTETLIEYNRNLSSQLITSESAFVNSQTRRLMATFGTSATTAMGLQSAMGIMGISQADLATMTSGQLRYLQDLMRTWFDGINSIDATALREYTEFTQEFQRSIGTSKLQIQLNVMKAMIESGGAQNLLASFSELMATLADLSGTNAAKSVIDLFGNTLAFFVKMLNLAAKLTELASPALDKIASVLNVILEIINYIADTATFAFSGIRDLIGGGSSAIGTNYYGATNNNTRNNVVTITETTTNNFNGNDTSVQALANANASNTRSYEHRLAIATMI